jgi:hypothetical protein
MRLRFTIRDLLWLTIVAALAAGWWTSTHPKHTPEYTIKIPEFASRQP